MTEERKRLLDNRLREAIARQPKIRTLRKLLLEIGGAELVAPPAPDSNVPLLIDSGFIMAGPVRHKVMRAGSCHRSVSRVWRRKRSGIVGVGTGYALSEDGLWRQHSWGVQREGILETTVPRSKYFGLLLQGADADWFAASNSD